MSQPHASSSISTPLTTTRSSNFQAVFEAALKEYEKMTKIDLLVHPFASQLDSPAAILTTLQDQAEQSRSGDERLKRWLVPTINVLHAFSGTLEGVSSVFPPSKAIFAGVGVLLLAAKDVEKSQDVLIDVFERIENFFRRLEIYTEVPPTPAMTEMMVKIMVEVLDILAIVTKEMKQSRSKKFIQKVAGVKKLEDSLKRLDKMTSEELLIVSAEVLKLTRAIDMTVQSVNDGARQTAYNVDNVERNLEEVDEKVRGVGEKVRDVNEKIRGVDARVQVVVDVQRIAYSLDDVKRRQLRERFRRWQSPPDPSTNHNIASDLQLEGTAKWFCQGGVFEEWMVKGSLLWIHGKPGSGKSILCSAIIQDIIRTLYRTGSASMAYFYFDLRDMDKRSCRNLLPSLLAQLSDQSDPFCDILSRLYEAHDDGMRQPSDSALVRCLKEMISLPDQAPVYLVMDALDECPNTPGDPSSREHVLDLVKDLVGLRLASLRICVTSRPDVDIQNALESLVSHSVSLHDESGQKKDIADYIRFVVDSDRSLCRLRDDDRKLVIETLSRKADGMFRWVSCQLDALRRCIPSRIRKALGELPRSLDEIYEHVLKGIERANRQHAYHLLQCLAVAIRPLHVEELAEILDLKKGWRWKSQQEAVLSTCSSLVVVVNDGSHHVVQFSHFSVKEFLTSDRLANSSEHISHFHILPEPAHTFIAKACLGILLRSDNTVGDAEARSNSLVKYAAEHWVGHAQFVSRHLQVVMRPLFDPAMPYFGAWLELYDIDQGWDGFTVENTQRGSPLYYASLCGFRDLAAHLIIEHPQHVNATLGRCLSPLAVALHRRHFDIADLLYRHGADVGIRGHKNRTLLHAASEGGFVEIIKWLLDHCVGAHSQQDNHETPHHLAETNGHPEHCIILDASDDANHTPLHLASLHGRFEIVQLLIAHGADVTSQDRDHRTPLHLASSSGSAEIVQVLIENGANVNSMDGSHNTPLHLASFSGSPTTVQVLIEHGAEVTSQDRWHRTPLHLASSSRSPETVRVLVKLGADVNAVGGSYNTPLHLASSSGSPETVRVLIELGADINAMGGSYITPLHLASSSGSAETVRVLIELGADVNSRDGSSNSPLHLASSSQSPETVRQLIEDGADLNSRDGSHNTPLHLASSLHSPEIARLLIEHGAEVTSQDRWQWTPLHLASSSGSPETVRLLIERGADVNAEDRKQKKPLHLASSSWHPETAQVLIDHGADVNAQDGDHKMPLHLAASSRSPEAVRLLTKHGADVNAKDGDGKTPLHLVSPSRSPKTVRVLIEHGADVNTMDRDHNTPLHLALTSWSPETVRLLLEHNADVNARDGSDKTPLHLASSQDEEFSKLTGIQPTKPDEKADIVQVLIQHGANVTARDITKSTPLHLASSKGSGKTVKLLLSHGADVNAQDGQHATPLHLAAASRLGLKGDVVHILLSHGANVYAKDNEGRTPFRIGSSKGVADLAELYPK